MSSCHLHQQNTITEDIHLGALQGWVGSLWCCIGRVSRAGCGHSLDKVSRAIVREFGEPGHVGAQVQENISAAHISVQDGVGLGEVQVVQSSGNVTAD